MQRVQQAQDPMEPRVLQALQAFKELLAHKEPLVLVCLAPRELQASAMLALRAPQERPGLPAPPVPLVRLEQALQVLQAFKDRLALLALARLAIMT